MASNETENKKDNIEVCGCSLNSAKRLTPLDLNAIKLDPKHTLLTPDYLEKLMNEPSET